VPVEKKTIIVVDDDEAVRDSLKFSLELQGLKVHACDSAESLLRYPGLKEAACLVLDYRMPEVDGFALRKRLAARGLSMPLILITAPVSSELHRRARNAGFFAVLEKPLLDNALLENVHAAIAI
jgi:two-component system response regulator FixJ